MPNPIAKFSLIFAYLLNLSGVLILAWLFAALLKIVRWRIVEQSDVLTLFVKLAFGVMVLGFIVAMIVKICSKNRLIGDYAAYLMTFWAIWAVVSFWCGIAVAIIIFLAALPGSVNELSSILRLIGQVYFWGLLVWIYKLAKNVWALSGEVERPRQQKSQLYKPKFVRNKNHSDD